MNNKFIYFITMLLCYINVIKAQNENQSWIGGHCGYVDQDTSNLFALFSFKFNTDGTKKFSRYKCEADIKGGNASICDKNGDMIIFFTGEEIYNKNLEPMKGSDSLNFFPKGQHGFQASYMQNGLILPYPKHPNQYFVIYQRTYWGEKMIYNNELLENTFALKTYYCLVDMNLENGLGKVIKREQLLCADTLSKGRMAAVRHGNGRDWWFFNQELPKNTSSGINTYYVFLLDPKGVRLHHKQTIGIDNIAVLGQTLFSPDGKYFLDYDTYGYPTQSTLYKIDRCTGMLSEPQYINFQTEQIPGGAAFSPNSRYLYINRYDTLFQFDLQAANLWKSKKVVGIWDEFFHNNFTSTGFFNMKLAHDGKIYIATQSSTPYMHVIHNPGLPGIMCNFEIRGLKLPSLHFWNVPNYPDFKLGALKGSPCDTLGLGVATRDIEKEDIKIFPNPAAEGITIQCEKNTDYQLIIRNITGQVLKQESILNGNATIDTSDLQNGMIICELWAENQRVATEKIIIIH